MKTSSKSKQSVKIASKVFTFEAIYDIIDI
uniref:Uncharacterized protein n=1 Tax=Myoviridae sp. ctbEa13 TaxID=2825136 RepID=A0A8S5VBH0_9CAUD|nr:MAG TPA: hypothetical protein [Myoviridae sp. ctbEa13]